MNTLTLKRSKDRKVANAATPKGAVAIANAFGLPNGKRYSCLNQTDVCKSVCYAGNLERMYPNVRDLLMHNWVLMSNSSKEEMIRLIADMIADFVADCERRGAEPLFRIHWDGDFFSLDYVRAWDAVIAAHPEVTFWVYTRNPQAAALLAEHEHANLGLYFSADAENWKFATSLRRAYGNQIRLAVLAETFEAARAMYMDEYGKPIGACPEQRKQIPLISPEGGACANCGLCPKGKVDISFSVTKK